MKVIIAGSRDIFDFNILDAALAHADASGIDTKKITEIVDGGAAGVDAMGRCWAKKQNIKVTTMKADWNNIDVPGAIVRENAKGKYNAKAGIDRNRQMAEYADALIAIWDGESKGTENMIETMEELKKKVVVYQI